MNIKIHRISIVYIILNIIIILPLFVVLEKDLNIVITSVSAVQLIYSLWVLKKEKFSLFSLPCLFIILSEVLHFGEAYLLAIGREDLFSVTNITLAGNMKTYNNANIFALLVQAFIVFGMTLAVNNLRKNLKNEQHQQMSFKNNRYELSRIFIIGLIMVLIGIVPNIMYYNAMSKIVLSGGIYAGIRESVHIGPLQLLIICYKPGVIMMILGSENHKRRAKFIILIASMFEIYCMVSGNRGLQIITIVLYLFLYYRIFAKINWKNIIIFVVLGYLAITLLYFISSLRNVGLGTLEKPGETFLKVLTGEPFYGLLAEQGSTLNIVALTLSNIPLYNSFSFGFTYILGIVSILPDTGGWLGNIPNMYGTLYYLNTSLPLGDSYIAELYHNFGWFSFPFAILEGVFIGYVAIKIEQAIKNREYLNLGGLMILFLKLLWMVRGAFNCWMYDFVWTWIIIKFINMLLKQKYYYKNKMKIQV